MRGYGCTACRPTWSFKLPHRYGNLTGGPRSHWPRGTASAARQTGGRSHLGGQPLSRWCILILQFSSRRALPVTAPMYVPAMEHLSR